MTLPEQAHALSLEIGAFTELIRLETERITAEEKEVEAAYAEALSKLRKERDALRGEERKKNQKEQELRGVEQAIKDERAPRLTFKDYRDTSVCIFRGIKDGRAAFVRESDAGRFSHEFRVAKTGRVYGNSFMSLSEEGVRELNRIWKAAEKAGKP